MRKFSEINWGDVLIHTMQHFLVVMFTLLTLEAIFYAWIVNPNDYISYVDIKPNKKTYWMGEEGLFFRSFAIVKQPATVYWEDTLFCDPKNDDYKGGYFSQYRSSFQYNSPRVIDGSSVWHYNAEIPIQRADCYLRSQSSVEFKIFFVFKIYRPIPPIDKTEVFSFMPRTE